MWRTSPVFMIRYWLSSWLISAALFIMPSRRYSDELRRRVYQFRNEVMAEVITHRAKS